MKLTEQMILAALRFRDSSLWEKLDDAMIYAVSQPDGSIAYYNVMGNAGTHISLGCYMGDEGFSTFLKVIYGRQKDTKRAFEIAQSYNFISCDFVNASDSLLSKEEKEFIRETAKKFNLKIRRSHGWPEFTKVFNGEYFAELNNEKDITAILLGLEAGVAISHRVNNSPKGKECLSSAGFDIDSEYPPLQGGQSIPLLFPKTDGEYEWRQTLTPVFNPTKINPVIPSDSQKLSEMKELPHKGGYQAKIIHMPSPIGNARHHYFPVALLLAALPTGFLIPILPKSESKDRYESVVCELAARFVENDIVPAYIQIDDEITELVIGKLCEVLSINLEKCALLEFIEEGWNYLFHSMYSR